MNIMNAKKKYTIVLIIAMIALLLWFIWRVFLFSPTPAKPHDTALEFWIVENVKSVDWVDHDTPYEMYGGEAYLGKDYPLELMDGNIQIPKEHIIYTVTAWPDYSDDGAYVTEIEITDPAISVYGLTVNSSFEEFDRVFCGQGYDISIDKNGYWENHRATKNGITFSMESGAFCESAENELHTPLQKCSLTADDGASSPLEWCTHSAEMVHGGRGRGAAGRHAGNYSGIPLRLRMDSPSIWMV